MIVLAIKYYALIWQHKTHHGRSLLPEKGRKWNEIMYLIDSKNLSVALFHLFKLPQKIPT